MFNCDHCHNPTGPCVQPARVIVERRAKTYGPREVYVRGPVREDGKPTATRRTDPGGSGWEIAREAVVCPPCGAKAKGNEAGKAGEVIS